MIKALIRTALLLIALGIAFIVFLLTPVGLKFTTAITTENVPGKLDYSHASGLLSGPITLDNVRYTLGDTLITAKKITWNWKLSAFFGKRLDIQSLQASDVQITYLKAAKKPLTETPSKNFYHQLQQFANNSQHRATQLEALSFHLPYTLVIEKAVINGIHFHRKNTPSYYAPSLVFHAVIKNNQINFELNTTLIQPTRLQLHWKINGTLRHYQTHLALTGNETNLQ